MTLKYQAYPQGVEDQQWSTDLLSASEALQNKICQAFSKILDGNVDWQHLQAH